MAARDQRLTVVGYCIAGLALLGLSGCGGIGGTPVPVSGAVTLNNTPLPFALVTFHPEQIGGRTVAAVTDIRGRYTLRDGEQLGVPEGTYRVTIRYFTGNGGIPQRPDADPGFEGDGWDQLLPAKYSEREETEILVVVLDPEEQASSFRHDLKGDDVPLPPAARPRGDVVRPRPATPDSQEPVQPLSVSTSSSFLSAEMIVYGGGVLLFLVAAGGVFLFVSRRRVSTAESVDPGYQYEGELNAEAPMPQPAAPAPRRKKKRKKKKVRKKSADADGDASAPIPDGDADTAGSPFPVLDEGMDDDEMAAAFLAGDEETIPAPKPKDSGESAVARRMLESGGFVKVQCDDAPAVNVKKVDDLPEDEFHIQGVFFEGVEDFNDEKLASFDKLPQLDTLDLAATAVTDSGLKSLKKFPTIRTLALSRTAVTDAGLEHLTALPNLRVLLLYRTKVSDSGLAHLKKLTHLKTIELKRTEVSKQAAKELQSELPKCKVII